MACKYKYNGMTYDSYQDLVAALSDEDMSKLTDMLFSQQSKQDAIYDKIIRLRTAVNLSIDNTEIIDGSPDIEHGTDSFTTQTFIDSQYFSIGDEAPMFRLSTKDYVDTMKRKFVADKEKTQEQADAWGDLVQQRWNEIAKNALDFHRLILGDSSDSLFEWSQRTANTAFAGITEKVKQAEDNIFFEVMKRNGRDHRGTGNVGKVIKGLNFEADLRGMAEKILGHVDYLVVRDNGDIEIFNVKTSTEPYSQWATAKKEKYKYQLALLKQMLAFHGIDSRHIRVNIVPVRLTYNDQYNTITDIEVQKAVPFDTKDLRYVFQKYDNVASQFIDSTVDFSQVDNASLLTVSKQLQHIFPGKDVRAEGIAETAKEWLVRNWKYCKPEALPGGGYRITLPDTKEVIEVSDSRKADKNEELIAIIQDRLNQSNRPFAGELSAYYLRTDLENSFRNGVFSSNSKGATYQYVSSQFSKYINDYKEDTNTGTRTYTWELLNSPALDAANIIALRHRVTGQVDVFTVSGTTPTATYSFKGRKNLLGYYLPDLNNERFEMECNYGNIDAVRTLAILNEVLPSIGGNIKLGQLKVIGLSGFQTRKGTFYEFDSLLKQWNTIVKVVNRNSNAVINNNFQEQGIECIAPEEVLRQTWVDITTAQSNIDMTELRGLGDLIDQKTLVDGSTIDGLMNMQTIEGKIEKLEQLIDRLREIAEERGINVQSPDQLVELTKSSDAASANIAKLYIVATQALSHYYGDISLNNEDFSTLEEYGMKTTSIGNSNVRRVGFLVQKSIDNIRAGILDEYMPNVMPIFKKFYEDAGYTAGRNAIIGDQVSVFKNLYELDENGENIMMFKNPYDPAADLKSYEREFLKKILYEFYKVRRNMEHLPYTIVGPNDNELLTNMPNDYLYVPLQAASSASKRANIKTNLEQFGKKLHRLITRPGEVFEETMGNLDSQDIEARDEAIDRMRVYNPYTRSYASLRERDLYIASKGVGFFETNMENIFIDFLSKQVQCDEFNKLLIRIKGIELALTLKGIAEGDEQGIKHTIKTIDDFVTLNIYNKSIMEKTSRKIDAWLNPLRGLVSKFYIAASPVAAVRDTLQGLQENFVQALIKYQTDINAKDVAFGYSEIFKEGCTNMMTMSKLNQFNIKYGFSNFDAAKVAERLKTGRGGVLNADNWFYWTLRAPDYLNRMTLFVAKLHHDGAYDAYSLDDEHRLKYDWRKDKRFEVYASGDTTNPKYNEQKALYYSMIRAFNVESSGKQLSYTDDLPDAYTPEQIRAIKTLAESIYGAYDQSSKAKYENIAIGRNFMFFSTWMNGIVDNYAKKRQISQSELKLEQETDYNGNPLFFTGDESGNMTTADTGLPVVKYVPIMVQGIFQTFGETFRELNGNGWNFKQFLKGDVWKNEVNRRNYKRAMSDFAIAMLLALLFKLWLTPEYNRHKAEADGRKVFENMMVELLYKSSYSSFDTFKGPYAVLTYLGESTSPATYTLQSKILSDTKNFVLGNKTAMQTLMGSQAFFRSMQDSYRMYIRDTQSK